MHIRIRLLLLACMILMPLRVMAQEAFLQTEHVRASLVSLHDAVVPGQPLQVGLRIEHAPGWHTYWRNPGDSGEPPSLSWQLPSGFTAGDIVWPAPMALPVGPLTNYGYEGDHLLPLTIRVPADLRERDVRLRLSATWLVCKIKCIPEEGEFALSLPVATQATPTARSGLFASAQARAPQSAANWTLSASAQAGGARLQTRLPASLGSLQAVRYFPYGEGLVESSGVQQLRVNAEGFVLDIPAAVQAVAPLTQLHGVVVLRNTTGHEHAFEINTPVTTTTANTPAVPTTGLWGALALAFLGGIILNLMPCVFPVLSIKLLALLKNENPVQARAHAGFYALGVIASFLLLALALIALRAAGEQIGWGFQLQSPGFVAGLALLFFVMGLNLSGVFEFGHLLTRTAGPQHGAASAIGTGVLAVFAASPCTAPFMGAALGFAIGQSAMVSLAVFAMLGMGMALPFVLLATWPAARRILPRPGAWMERLKQALAFPLYATTVWLAWVLGEQLGAAAMAWLGMALVLTACAAWAWRQRQGGGRRAWLICSLTSMALALGASLYAARSDMAPTRTEAAAWQNWSPEAVQTHLNAGRSVFVDFTAAWCVTCQVNKRLVLNRQAITQAFREQNIVALRADWTRHDPAITQALEALGRKGVPVYLVQRPGQAAQLLPEILTQDVVLNALKERSP